MDNNYDYKGGNAHFDPDGSLQRLERQRKTASAVVISVGLIVFCGVAYTLFNWWYKDPLDEEMLWQAGGLDAAVTRYFADNAEYPLSLEEAGQYFPADSVWPIEPYNGKSMHDTGSGEFTGPECVGMVHYEQSEVEGKTGYRIYVFGRDGVLTVFFGGFATEQ